MNTLNGKLGILSGNLLKIIAMILMVVDHVGYILFPNVEILRIIGRLSFPIFAFFIAEGCRHTRNKLRYFLVISICAIIYQLVLYFYLNDTYMCVFVTFSIGILICYALWFFKETLIVKDIKLYVKIISFLVLIASIVGAYFLNKYFEIDYGFFGCLTPAIVSLFFFTKNTNIYQNKITILLKKLDALPLHLIMLSVALICIWAFSIDISLKNIQLYSLLSIPILYLYSGQRGKYGVKYLFYIFYPAHLIILNLIASYLS